jgi:hypothetical protein
MKREGGRWSDCGKKKRRRKKERVARYRKREAVVGGEMSEM